MSNLSWVCNTQVSTFSSQKPLNLREDPLMESSKLMALQQVLPKNISPLIWIIASIPKYNAAQPNVIEQLEKQLRKLKLFTRRIKRYTNKLDFFSHRNYLNYKSVQNQEKVILRPCAPSLYAVLQIQTKGNMLHLILLRNSGSQGLCHRWIFFVPVCNRKLSARKSFRSGSRGAALLFPAAVTALIAM